MARTRLEADGNEYYVVPATTREANEWLQRAGATHLRFGTSQGKAVLKILDTGKVYLEAAHVRDLCWFLAWQPMEMQALGIPFFDWYRPQESWSKVREVTRKVYV